MVISEMECRDEKPPDFPEAFRLFTTPVRCLPTSGLGGLFSVGKVAGYCSGFHGKRPIFCEAYNMLAVFEIDKPPLFRFSGSRHKLLQNHTI